MGPRFARELRKDFRQLEADCHEYKAVDKKDDHFPKRLCLQAITGPCDQRQMPAEINSRGHRGQDAGNMQPLGREVRDKRRKQSNSNLHRRIIELLLHPSNNEAGHKTNRDSAQRDEHKLGGRITERETSRRHRRDGKLQRGPLQRRQHGGDSVPQQHR